MSSKKAIVLDIDENLIHSVVRKKPKTPQEIKKHEALKRQADFHFQLQGDQYYVFKRPGLDKFLKTVFREFDYVAFWTTGIKTYARNILKHILNINQASSNKLVFIYTRGDCARDTYGYYKPLKKVWKTSRKFRPKNTIMMDNTLMVMRDNLENGLLTPSYDEKNLKSDQYLPWLDLQIRKHLKKPVGSKVQKGGNKKMTPIEFVKTFSQPK